ncbi:MAG: YHS domain-containing (seleno)protein [Pseudomonadales bacterium]
MPGKTITTLFFSLFASVMAINATAADPINTSFFGNIAIEGYDPVAYFQQNQAVEGSKKYQHEWQGAKWNFSSGANRDLFAADPTKYAPQYGGYCAYAVSQNTTAGVDPDQFTILDGKLYLNYNAKIQKKWQQDRDSYIDQADKNWPKVLE